MEQNEKLISRMPVVALRGMTVFPDSMLHFEVGRPKSIAAFKAAMAGNRDIFLTAQRDLLINDPEEKDLYAVGVTAEVRQMLRLPGEENVRVAIRGIKRGRLLRLSQSSPYLEGEIADVEEKTSSRHSDLRLEALKNTAKRLFDDYAQIIPDVPDDIILGVAAKEDPGSLADFIAGNVMLKYEDKQAILEEFDPYKRLEKLCALLAKECQILEIEEDINDRVQSRLEDNQREYYLREQMKVLSSELNDGKSPEDEVEKFREDILKLHLDEKSEEKLLRECDRLARMAPQSPESVVSRTYIETCIGLPWNKLTKDKLDLTAARKVLDKDHYGLEKVKDRIIELIAVRKLAPDVKGQIICLVGPPGVGKTSVARSIARALGRKYVRISLGGVNDEAEIRGHRKTYIGSMPGRIITAIQNAGTANPLMLLDEVDKLGKDYKGDPASALLEVLDSEQNFSFCDHYIEIPFDLSRVLFITTANDESAIPQPLLDRMEIIELGSYTHEEKFNIAKKHLVPKQIGLNGLKKSQLKIKDDALRMIIDCYTREAGVRKLEREIAKVCRKAAARVAEGEKSVTVTKEGLKELLGTVKYNPDSLSHEDEIGVVNGLAWTSTGGEMLKVETLILDGNGKIELTGSLGDVMKESAKAAVSYVRSRADVLGIEKTFYKDKDIHIHVPEGAVPKDGPSAGVTIATSLVSALTKTPVKGDVAMTGEITLTGRVLPIGGLREKSMAAYRNGISTVIIPAENKPDLDDVDKKVKENTGFLTAKRIDDVLSFALRKPPEKTVKPDDKETPIGEFTEQPGLIHPHISC
ncbi:MAG: endopeptidase La [Clostridiales bacterium]|nr:endopeptidase La [Clostridiales bacterium]